MEINKLNNRVLSAYKNVAGNPVKNNKSKAPEGGKTGSDNFDKVEFNFDKSLSAAKADILNNVTAEADAAKIENIKAAYAGIKLPVTSQQIAGAIAD